MARLIVIVPWTIQAHYLRDRQIIACLPDMIKEDDTIVLYISPELWLSSTKMIALLERLQTQVIVIVPDDKLMITLTSELRLNGKVISTNNQKDLVQTLIEEFLNQQVEPNA